MPRSNIAIMYRICFLFFLLFAGRLDAQDVTGVWHGYFKSNNAYDRLLGGDDRYKFEVQIAQESKNFQAVTYSYKTTVFYGKATASGTINSKTGKVLLQELKIVEVRMAAGDACIMTCFMQYSRSGDDEFLEGSYVSMNTRDSTNCGKGTIFLRKVANSDFYKEPFVEKREKEILKGGEDVASSAPKNTNAEKKKLPAPVAKKPVAGVDASKKPAAANPVASNKPLVKTPVHKPGQKKPQISKANAGKDELATLKRDTTVKSENKISVTSPVVIPPVLTERKNELAKTLLVETADIELNIYDNGIVDNDSITVYYDKKQILHNARLSEKPIVIKLHLDDTSIQHELVMVADNEGDIPPNTSLMVVKAGDKRYEVHITSSEQKNAVVVFKYEKPK